MSPGSSHTVVLGLLRGFTVSVDEELVRPVSGAQRLIAFLALKHRPLNRSYVAEALWPETTVLKANANLRSSIWRTQRSCGHLIDASAQQVTLAGNVTVDLWEAAAHARRLLDASVPCDDILTAATQCELSADLLPDWYDDDWVLIEREHFHQLRLHALEAMCVRFTSAERYGEAVDTGLAAVRAEPLRESAHRALIKAHLAAGNRWEAMRQYDQCRDLLLDELGLEPSDDLSALLPLPHVRAAFPVNRLVAATTHPGHLVRQRSSISIGAFRHT